MKFIPWKQSKFDTNIIVEIPSVAKDIVHKIFELNGGLYSGRRYDPSKMASCTMFTIDEVKFKTVIEILIDLKKKGVSIEW